MSTNAEKIHAQKRAIIDDGLSLQGISSHLIGPAELTYLLHTCSEQSLWKTCAENLYRALSRLSDRGGIFRNMEDGQGRPLDEKLNKPMREFRKLRRRKQ